MILLVKKWFNSASYLISNSGVEFELITYSPFSSEWCTTLINKQLCCEIEAVNKLYTSVPIGVSMKFKTTDTAGTNN